MAIESVLSQTFQDFEIIVVDDCSDDNSLAVVKQIAETDRRINVFRTQANSGPAGARNLAIEHARGEWLAVLDADDVWLPAKLEQQVVIIKRGGPEIILVGTGLYEIDESGRRIRSYTYSHKSSDLKRALVRGGAFPPHSSIMYRASTFRSLAGFRANLAPAEDCDLWLRLAEWGEFTCVADPLIEYRHHSSNISNNITARGYRSRDWSMAARVCHLLRLAGFGDPADGSDAGAWETFMRFIHKYNSESGIYEYMFWKYSLRQACSCKDGVFNGILSALKGVFGRPSYLGKLALEHMVGLGDAQRCFGLWVSLLQEQRSCAASSE